MNTWLHTHFDLLAMGSSESTHAGGIKVHTSLGGGRGVVREGEEELLGRGRGIVREGEERLLGLYMRAIEYG